jgi:hypothetical protein
MKTTSRTRSRPDHIICPACGSGELRPRGSELAGCDSCGISVRGEIFRSLEQIVTLPDALGVHACECGHPEMRRLPDGGVPLPGLRLGSPSHRDSLVGGTRTRTH